MAVRGYEFYLFQHSKIKFVSSRGHVISSIYFIDTDEIIISLVISSI